MSRPRGVSSRTLAALLRRDPALRPLLKAFPFPGFPTLAQARNESHFAALGRAILFQQLATKAASTIHRRVCALTPGPRFPRPQDIPALAAVPHCERSGVEQSPLRGAGVSGSKQRSLVDLAERTVDGRLRLRAVGRCSDGEVIDRLITVFGIGVWSAQMFLIFRLGRLDVMPSADLGVQEGLRRLDALNERPGPAAVEARAETWAPLRSVAAWALWRACELTPSPPARRR